MRGAVAPPGREQYSAAIMAPTHGSLLLALAASALAASAAAQGCAPRSSATDITGAPYALQGAACPVHDPAIAYDAASNAYYVFGTDQGPTVPPFLLIRCSPDLTTWTVCGSIFPDSLPYWAMATVPGVANAWAPDVVFMNGLWHVYYALSTFGSQTSAIGLATSPSLDPTNATYGWTDRGPVLLSNDSCPYNAIDPTILLDDATGEVFMAFGSFWQGTYLIQMDAATGMPLPGAAPVHVAQRASPDALEASFMLRNAAQGQYYYFSSWNFCCRGVQSTYEVRAGRNPVAANASFAAANGTALLDGGGTFFIGGGFGWAAAGGQSVLRAPANNVMVMHAYDGVSGDPWLQIVGIDWEGDNTTTPSWPTAVPLSAVTVKWG
jgi:arabinan endo-1,5-alpha-L-arabinosidase